jgi:hypothetical protein
MKPVLCRSCWIQKEECGLRGGVVLRQLARVNTHHAIEHGGDVRREDLRCTIDLLG